MKLYNNIARTSPTYTWAKTGLIYIQTAHQLQLVQSTNTLLLLPVTNFRPVLGNHSQRLNNLYIKCYISTQLFCLLHIREIMRQVIRLLYGNQTINHCYQTICPNYITSSLFPSK